MRTLVSIIRVLNPRNKFNHTLNLLTYLSMRFLITTHKISRIKQIYLPLPTTSRAIINMPKCLHSEQTKHRLSDIRLLKFISYLKNDKIATFQMFPTAIWVSKKSESLHCIAPKEDDHQEVQTNTTCQHKPGILYTDEYHNVGRVTNVFKELTP